MTTTSAPDARDRRRNMLLLYLLAAISTTCHGALELIFPLNLDRLEHPYSVVGLTMALVGLGALVSRVPGGAWYRLSRARALTAAAFAIMGLSTAGLALGDGWALQAAFGAVHGITFGLATTFLMALLIEVRPRDENFAPIMAWYTAAISSGYAASAPLGAQSIEWFGHGAAFAIAGAVALVGGAISLALRPPLEEPAAGHGEARPVGGSSGAWRSLKGLPVGVWLATLLVFYINFLTDAYLTFFPIYALGVGIALSTVGILKSVHSLAATVIRFAAAGLFLLVPVGVVNHTSVLVMALATIGLSLVTAEPVLVAVFVLLGTCRGLLRVTSATMIADERTRPGASVGMASAVYNAGLDAGSMLGPPLAGLLAGALDIPTTFRVVALVLPAVYYAVWFAQRLRHGRAAATDVATAA